MKAYQCLMALVEPDQRGVAVARRAVHLAQMAGCRLILATLVEVDTGAEWDPHPLAAAETVFQTLLEEKQQHMAALRQQLNAEIPMEIHVAIRRGRMTVVELAAAHRVDLVMVGSHAPFQLTDSPWWFRLLTGITLPFDLLVVQVEPSPGVGAGLRQGLAGWRGMIRWPAPLSFPAVPASVLLK